MELLSIFTYFFGGILLLIGGWLLVTQYRYSRTTSKGKLMTDGPYRIVRHPYYAGFLYLVTGIALVYPIVETVTIFLFSLFYLVFSIRREEKVLIIQYGKRYKEYMVKVHWRLIPLIW